MDKPGNSADNVGTVEKDTVAAEKTAYSKPAKFQKTTKPVNGGQIEAGCYQLSPVTGHGSSNGGGKKPESDNLGDQSDRERWEEVFKFSVEVLGLSEEEARNSVNENIDREKHIAAGTLPDPYLEEIEVEFTLAKRPMTPEEEEFWRETVEFRTSVLGLSSEEAEESTTEDIERERQTAYRMKIPKGVETNGFHPH